MNNLDVHLPKVKGDDWKLVSTFPFLDMNNLQPFSIEQEEVSCLRKEMHRYNKKKHKTQLDEDIKRAIALRLNILISRPQQIQREYKKQEMMTMTQDVKELVEIFENVNRHVNEQHGKIVGISDKIDYIMVDVEEGVKDLIIARKSTTLSGTLIGGVVGAGIGAIGGPVGMYAGFNIGLGLGIAFSGIGTGLGIVSGYIIEKTFQKNDGVDLPLASEVKKK